MKKSTYNKSELYSDATIACDGHFFSVHKLVLSTCSEYFAGMFEHTPCKHPVIVLKDVLPRDVEFLLSYMYGGEVSVAQADLPSLIKAAETLQIKGLAAPDDPPSSPSANRMGKSSSDDHDSWPRTKRKRLSSHLSSSSQEDFTPLKVEPSDSALEQADKESGVLRPNSVENCFDVNESSCSSLEPKYYEDSLQFEDLPIKQEPDEGNDIILDKDIQQQSIEQSEWSSVLPSTLQGPQSDAESVRLRAGHNSTERSMQLPLQQSVQGETRDLNAGMRIGGLLAVHPCPMCPKRFQSRADVVRHLRTHTGEKPYQCPHCNYRAALKGNLKSHVISRHSQTLSTFDTAPS